MKKHYTVLILVTLLITLSACARPDVDKNDAVPELPVETEAAEEQAYIEDSTEDSIEDFIEDPPEDSVQDAESSLETESEEEIKEETEWLETDEQWRGRRTRSNSELEVTIERTDRSMVNEDGLTIASIYYDRPVVSGDTVAAEKITQFFEDEEQDWFAGRGRLLHIPGNDLEECPEINVLDIICEDIEKMRERYGDEDVAEWLCLYSVEARIMYMDENILSILQVEETRTERGGWRYFGCTFDLNTGELLKLTDLVDISVGDMENILSKVGYPDAYNVLSDEYIVSIDGKEINMAYQFCVDEKYLYLLDNTTKRYRDGMIYRVDETGEPVKLRCKVKREDHKNRIHSEIID